MQITIEDKHIHVDGQHKTFAGMTDFSMFYKFVKNQDITAVLANRKAIYAETAHVKWMFPCLRLLSQAVNIFQMKPGDYQYTSVTAFTNFVYEQIGFAIQWEICADCSDDVNSRREHFKRMVDAMFQSKYGSFIPSCGNEAPKNGWSPDDFKDLKPPCVASLGSNLGDADPYPGWGISMYHGRRDGVKGYLASSDLSWAKQGTDTFKGTGSDACIHDEPIGFDEVRKSGSRSTNPQVAYQIAFAASTAGDGGTFHSTNGVASEIIDPNAHRYQWACSQAFMVGLALADPAQSWNGII